MIVGVRPRHLVLSSANKPPRVAQGAHEIGGARCVPNGRSKVLEVPYEIKHDCARLGGVFPAHPSCCSGAGVLCVVSPYISQYLILAVAKMDNFWGPWTLPKGRFVFDFLLSKPEFDHQVKKEKNHQQFPHELFNQSKGGCGFEAGGRVRHGPLQYRYEEKRARTVPFTAARFDAGHALPCVYLNASKLPTKLPFPPVQACHLCQVPVGGLAECSSSCDQCV